MGSKKLQVNVEDLRTCERELNDSIDKLVQIQKDLQTAIDALKTDGGWESNSSKEYMKNYDSTWIAGVTDRKDIMVRMCTNIQVAIKEYEQVEGKAKKLHMS